MDDGSPDDTYEVATRAFRDEPRVTVLTKPNGGKASALNYGIQRAARRDRRLPRRRHAVRAGHVRGARRAARAPRGRRRRRQREGRQPREPRHALAGAGVRHVAEPRPARVLPAQLHHRDSRRGGRLAPFAGARGRRIHARHARRGPGPHDHDPQDGTRDRVRRARDRVDRGARHARHAVAAAVPLVVRHAAVRVEAPRRAVQPRATARSASSRCRTRGSSSCCSRPSRRSPT